MRAAHWPTSSLRAGERLWRSPEMVLAIRHTLTLNLQIDLNFYGTVSLPRISRYSVGGMPQDLWKAIEKALGLV